MCTAGVAKCNDVRHSCQSVAPMSIDSSAVADLKAKVGQGLVAIDNTVAINAQELITFMDCHGDLHSLAVLVEVEEVKVEALDKLGRDGGGFDGLGVPLVPGPSVFVVLGFGADTVGANLG